jgi:hypothetical protein
MPIGLNRLAEQTHEFSLFVFCKGLAGPLTRI